MTRYEYRVLPAPHKGVKARGVKTTEDRFAHALMQIMNELGREGWEYLRTDTLPCEERVGLTGRTTKFQNMLVFRRALAEPAQAAAPAESPRAANVGIAPRGPEANGISAGRLAATLSAAPPEVPMPSFRRASEPGAVPRLGAATGKGLPKPGSDLAAE